MTGKKKRRRTFWKNFKFKYKLTIVNENSLEEVVSLQVSKFNGVSVLLATFFVLFVIAALIVSFTPLRNYLPGYMNSDVRRQIVDNALRADSLQQLLDKQNLYVMNIQDIFRGEVRADSIHSLDSLTVNRSEELMERTQSEEKFRKEFEEQEKYNLSALKDRAEVKEIILYRPTRGLLSNGFDPERKHYGVDISANPSENVLAALDGTVIFSGYAADMGYVIQLQHSGNLVSVYKHCGSLMKATGDKVAAGEVIALIGKEHMEGNGPHLHFELWHRGLPLDPQKYIVF